MAASQSQSFAVVVLRVKFHFRRAHEIEFSKPGIVGAGMSGLARCGVRWPWRSRDGSRNSRGLR